MPNVPIKAVITAEDRASSVLRNFGTGIESVGAKALHLTKRLAQVGAAAIAAGTAFAVKSAADFEQSRIAFETMLGSADKARKMLKEVSDFAQRTPFELPEVVTGAKQLLAYNIEAEKILPTFKALGNIAAGVGKDKLPNLILAFGQVRAATRLTGMELRQFTEAGVPLLSTLAKQMGKTEAQITEMVSEGKIGFAQVEKAIFGMSQEGGKFFNLMDRQSRTFSGVLSNVRDAIGRLARTLLGISETGDIAEGSIFARLSEAAVGFLNFLNTHGEEIKAFFVGLMTFGKQAFDVIRKAIEILQPAIDAVVMMFRDFLLPTILKNKDEFILLAKLIGVVLIGAIGAILLALAALGLALAALIEISARIRNVMVGTFNAIRDAILGAIKAFDELMKKTTGGGTKDFAGNVRKGFKELFGGRQLGGHVGAGQGVVVGEKRPELFVPSTGGRVIPNVSGVGGGTTININLTAGAFTGSRIEARKFAKEILNNLKDIANQQNTTPARMLGA